MFIQQIPPSCAFDVVVPPVVCVLRLGMAAQFPGAKYLPFGYYVRARKRADA